MSRLPVYKKKSNFTNWNFLNITTNSICITNLKKLYHRMWQIFACTEKNKSKQFPNDSIMIFVLLCTYFPWCMHSFTVYLTFFLFMNFHICIGINSFRHLLITKSNSLNRQEDKDVQMIDCLCCADRGTRCTPWPKRTRSGSTRTQSPTSPHQTRPSEGSPR